MIKYVWISNNNHWSLLCTLSFNIYKIMYLHWTQPRLYSYYTPCKNIVLLTLSTPWMNIGLLMELAGTTTGSSFCPRRCLLKLLKAGKCSRPTRLFSRPTRLFRTTGRVLSAWRLPAGCAISTTEDCCAAYGLTKFDLRWTYREWGNIVS